MTWIVKNLWLIPVLPLLAAGLSALAKQPQRAFTATLAIGAMGGSFLLSCAAFVETLSHAHGETIWRATHNFDWFALGNSTLQLGWVLDPLTAVMLVMVTFVGLLIFIYSVGYMAHDENFTRFFCFLSLFGAAMLGLLIANSLLLFFMCWELVGLASYLLIGFWFHKPSAAAAAKKAFITTRIGDMGFFLGLIWLYHETGTLLFYNGGAGCLEMPLGALAVKTTLGGLAVSTAVGLLIFCGAIGKSGQVPLHVWLPDAMEGPTPVSALIHAATMVAAGVFLVARVYPLMALVPAGAGESQTLIVVTWIGAITAVFASLIAVAQTDIKRILAYSTVAQLGFMFMGLGVGGVAVGMFHLITHAFFKALLFLGAGSVIHGCHEEQDIRNMGGVKKYMPVTFATYAVGMMALAGVPFFAGFFSKDEILHAAHGWPVSQTPFVLGLVGALLTAFYMTRQMCYVFAGNHRGNSAKEVPTAQEHGKHKKKKIPHVVSHDAHAPHESPAVMTIPLVILAVFAFGLGFLGTPAWPWFQQFLTGAHEKADLAGALPLMLLSTVVVGLGVSFGWQLYGKKPIASATALDPLEKMQPELFAALRGKFFVDELYEATVIRFNAAWARWCDTLDRVVLDTVVMALSYVIIGGAWASKVFDEFVINLSFDQICQRITGGGGFAARLQDGQLHTYLRVIGVALMVLVLFLVWGGRQ